MNTHRTSVVVDAPSETVWRLLSEVTHWPRWLSTVDSVEALDGDALVAGHRFEVHQPRLKPAVWTVTAVDPLRRFEWRAHSPGMRMVADHVLERLGPDRTLVRLQFEFRGVVGTLLGRIFASTTARYVEQEAQALKVAAEQASSPA